jgi:transposase
MSTEHRPQTPGEKATLRAQSILEVRSGKKTAAQAAGELGVSRKTWYKWENRALEAMIAALTDRPTGRPAGPAPDPETLRLEEEVSTLRRQVQHLEGLERVREVMRTAQGPLSDPQTGPGEGTSRKKLERQSSS